MTRSGLPDLKHSRRGFALLIVLCVLALISVVMVRLVASGRSQIALSRGIVRATALEAAADGGVFAAIFHTMAQDPVLHWAPDAAPHLIRQGDIETSVIVKNEAGKINPNFASPILLVALLQVLGLDAYRAQHLAAAIVDWREAQAIGKPGEIKGQNYRAAGLDYGPPGTQYQSLTELRYVLGMTEDVYQTLLPHFSLAPVADPNPRFADPVVKAALARVSTQPGAAAAVPPQPVLALVVLSQARQAGGDHYTRQVTLTIDARDAKGFVIQAWE